MSAMSATETAGAPGATPSGATDWKKTACILCTENCGLEVQIEDGHFTRIRGDKSHHHSRGYLCQKASRLDYYQNHNDRLTTPLRRRADNTFEAISWDIAIGEIAERLVALRDEHTGRCFAFSGGGGQGNHLGGIYGNALKRAMKSRFHYSSLAQEKTGGFWVNGHLYGRQSAFPTNDVPNADFILFLGTNPWQSHGFPRARKVLGEISKDPNRKMVVVDPWRTKTAELADVHLAVRPGRDAYLLSAMLGTIVQEGLEAAEFIENRAVGFERIREVFSEIPVDQYAEFAGLDPALVRQVAREYAAADKAAIRADLGLEHTFHSTLNDYLGKLLYLITGHFAREGCNHLLAQFLPIIGHSGDPDASGGKYWRTTVGGVSEISQLFPPNELPGEINNDDPGRIRAVWVDSMNPINTAADTQAYVEAFEKLELLVVVDVAMTETAQLADYVLPASSQFEKWEATFFGAGVPSHIFHLREPLFEPMEGTLAEPEIYTRLLRAMGETASTSPLLGAVDQVDAMAPQLRDQSDNFKMVAAPIFMGSQTYASKNKVAVERTGSSDEGMGLGASLFGKIISERGGAEIGRFDFEETWDFVRHGDGRIHLAIDELLGWLPDLEREIENGFYEDEKFPFLLSAGGRRSYNANQIFRDPAWRRDDPEGALWIHPDDLDRLGLASGTEVVVESNRGRVTVTAEADPGAQPGFVALPHGYGMTYPGEDGGPRVADGPAVNILTAAGECDPIARTPYHKNVRVKIRKA